MATMPTIHLNGTSRGELFEQNYAALEAIAEARVALQAATPNGRDYYPQGPKAILEALQDHQRRLQLLEIIYNELHAIAEHCQPVK